MPDSESKFRLHFVEKNSGIGGIGISLVWGLDVFKSECSEKECYIDSQDNIRPIRYQENGEEKADVLRGITQIGLLCHLAQKD